MDNNVNIQEPKKTSKGLIIGIVLLVLGLGIGIPFFISYKNVDPVIQNSRRSSMRSTAQQIISSVQSKLSANYELYPGTYEWNKDVLDYASITAPFGGEYVYATSGENEVAKYVYRLSTTKDVKNDCGLNKTSFITIDRDESGAFHFSICLSTTKGGWLAGTRDQLDSKDDTIFYGDAKK